MKAIENRKADIKQARIDAALWAAVWRGRPLSKEQQKRLSVLARIRRRQTITLAWQLRKTLVEMKKTGKYVSPSGRRVWLGAT